MIDTFFARPVKFQSSVASGPARARSYIFLLVLTDIARKATNEHAGPTGNKCDCCT